VTQKIDVIKALEAQGLVQSGLAVQMERLQPAAGPVALGDPLPLEDLLALAEISPDDVARAMADWDGTSGLPGLLHARQVVAT
jgi:hypothetical protein